MTVVIVGGSGYIGSILSRKLLEKQNRVIVVDIKAPTFTHPELFFIQCDVSAQPLPYDVLEHTDAVVNLAGRTIAGKWNQKVKDEIRHSRVASTQTIIQTLAQTKSKPGCFICASAIGFYGDTKEALCDESCSRGEGFLAEVVSEWERVALSASEMGVRTVCVRTAPVLGNGGFLKELTKTARFGFLLKLSKKDFWMSWIHEDDIVATYLFAIETHTLQGVFNAAAPEAVPHRIFMRTLAKLLHRKVVGTIPRFVAKKIFGEFFEEITKSQRIVPGKLVDKGFSFAHPTLQDALRAVYKKHE